MIDEPARKNVHRWERADDEWYVEPVRATEQLLTAEGFVGDIWDPACGQGNVIVACGPGRRVFGTDIRSRTTEGWFLGEHDFLGLAPPPLQFLNIITNPPFGRAKLAEAFIRRALELTPGKVAVFVDIRFLAGADRAEGLYAQHPPSRAWGDDPRVSCPPGDHFAGGGKARNGTSDYVWLVWDQTAPATSMPPLGWLRRPL